MPTADNATTKTHTKATVAAAPHDAYALRGALSVTAAAVYLDTSR